MTADNCERFDLLRPASKNAIEEVAKELNFKDFKITASDGSTKGGNFLGEIYRIKVKGIKKNGYEDSMSFILKESPEIIREMFPIADYYRKEIFFYSSCLPMLDKMQSNLKEEHRFYYAKLFKAVTEEHNELLIFEDLCVKGFRMHDRFKPFDYDHISMLIENLARFHATTIVLKAKHPDVFNEFTSQISDKLDYGDYYLKYLKVTQTKLPSIIKDKNDQSKVFEYLKNNRSEIERLLKAETAAPYNVICHGDCWSTNFLFKYRDEKLIETRFVDWQIARCASPITDLAYLIFMGSDKSLRSRHYEDMLNLYYNTMRHNVTNMGVDISKYYSEKIYRDHIKEFMAVGFLLTSVFLPLALNQIDTSEIKDYVNKDEEYAYSDEFIERINDIVHFCIQNEIIS